MERSIEEFEESQTNPKKIKFSFPRFNFTKTYEVDFISYLLIWNYFYLNSNYKYLFYNFIIKNMI